MRISLQKMASDSFSLSFAVRGDLLHLALGIVIGRSSARNSHERWDREVVGHYGSDVLPCLEHTQWASPLLRSSLRFLELREERLHVVLVVSIVGIDCGMADEVTGCSDIASYGSFVLEPEANCLDQTSVHEILSREFRNRAQYFERRNDSIIDLHQNTERCQENAARRRTRSPDCATWS